MGNSFVFLCIKDAAFHSEAQVGPGQPRIEGLPPTRESEWTDPGRHTRYGVTSGGHTGFDINWNWEALPENDPANPGIFESFP